MSHNRINATLPNDKTPDTITLDEAVALIDARAAKMDGAPTRGASRRKARPARETTAATDVVAEAKPAAKRSAHAARPKSATKATDAKPKAPAHRAKTASQ